MKTVIDLDDEIYDEIKNKGQGKWNCREMDNAIRQSTPLPDNATNGDMMKAVFPNLHFSKSPFGAEYAAFVNHHPLVCCSEDWWGAPYEAESEGKE